VKYVRMNDNIRLWSTYDSGAAGGADGCFMQKDTGGVVYFFLGDTATYIRRNTGTSLSTGAATNIWRNWACVWHGGFKVTNLVIYRDAVKVDATSTTIGTPNTFDATAIPLTVGASAIGSANAYAYIEGLKIWNRFLTPEEVTNEYNRTKDKSRP